MAKNPLDDAGDMCSIPGSGGFPGVGHGSHTPVLPGKSQEQMNLLGYSP